MMRLVFPLCIFVAGHALQAQSLEFMAGHNGLFADVQWLKFLDQNHRWSIFSRTRATVDYDNNTDLFNGAYFNFTTNIGIGASLVGKINSAEGSVDAGAHIFKAKENWMLFGLASAGLKSDLEYNWFSIFRYTPKLGARWHLYTSLELFTVFIKNDHVASVQRLRAGLDYRSLQFGPALNLAQLGADFRTSHNFGGFIRKSF